MKGTAMPDIQHIELRENHAIHVVLGPGPGAPPVDDPPPAEQPQEAPGETGEPELQVQTRESTQSFKRAIARLSAE
jgi:hypothetical protein